ncbi:11230_t:CDS:2 [Rhizophagus irregularis]|nr:11230_t:CDS:2 [Rhizophagus irregularis]
MAYFEQDQVTDIRRSNDIGNISFGFMLTNKINVAIKRIKKPPTDKDGNLRNYIENNKLSFNRKIEIAINITNGIRFLHKNDMIHENLVKSKKYSYIQWNCQNYKFAQ